MANTKSAKKAIRVSQRKRQFNIPVISKIRTVQKKARIAVEKVTTENNVENVTAAKSAIIAFEKEIKRLYQSNSELELYKNHRYYLGIKKRAKGLNN